mmetsp:Transcript_14733/g.24563  ORF Transcript_14733/g.24563 Transcript_14733/m.24563 type:complete len:96 (-) Transcript_14733:237-524(-)
MNSSLLDHYIVKYVTENSNMSLISNQGYPCTGIANLEKQFHGHKSPHVCPTSLPPSTPLAAYHSGLVYRAADLLATTVAVLQPFIQPLAHPHRRK